VEWADVLVGGQFVCYHGGEVVDFGVELPVFLAEFRELGVDVV